MTTLNKYLVTSALPYANGDIHIGHLVEYIETDIFVRSLKMMGEDVIYMCADDTHGTPILMKARSLNIQPEELIKKYNIEHQQDFNDFQIHFDCYYSTHSEENEKHSTRIFNELKKNGHIFIDEVEQYFCENEKMFLSDRFIKGTCPNPNCKASNQYGDVCEICGFHYNPTDLSDPRCATCGSLPVRKRSKHYFFRLSDFHKELYNWSSQKEHLQSEIFNSINEWLKKGLKDWDISRDAPYFGFKIPGEEEKYFYVWLDAPVGYIATTEHYCKEHGKDFNSYWFDPKTIIYHFIGKDIVYFHTLFWPAMLMGSGYNVPNAVFVHGFLTVNGEKMSKSRGTFITARSFLRHLNPQYLRYYYASKLSANSDDIDMNLDDFRNRVNADLVNNIINIGSRAVSMLIEHFDGQIGEMSLDEQAMFLKFQVIVDSLKTMYREREFSKAMRSINEIADRVNKYFAEQKPWETVLTNPLRTHQICAFSINAFKLIMTMLKPVLPKMAQDVEAILQISDQQWDDATVILPSNHVILDFKHLLSRVDLKNINALIEENKHEVELPASGNITEKMKGLETTQIALKDITRLDMRVGEILEVESIAESETLYKLKVNVGREITIFAGIKNSYPDYEDLIGKKILVVMNIKPKEFRGYGISEGMLLAATSQKNEIIVAEFSKEAKSGWKVS